MALQITLSGKDNLARGLAAYAIQFCRGEGGQSGNPSRVVQDRTLRFFVDAQLCGLSALACGTNAPTVMWHLAHQYTTTTAGGVSLFGSKEYFLPRYAVGAKCAAVREWDSNGTSFAYFPKLGHVAGEFGHNDYYNLCIAAAQLMRRGGDYALLGMIAHDEIRVRLGSVFALKDKFIDHVLHGAIASAAVWGAMTGATVEQIERAIGMVIAHHVPTRAIRAGHELSDSKGASAAISTMAAMDCVELCRAGFLGPKDIFANPQAVFRLFEGPGQKLQRVGSTAAPNLDAGHFAPFDLCLSLEGDDFAIMGMHLKLGLYEHQSAGAIEALIDLLTRFPSLLTDKSGEAIGEIRITAYGDAYRIIGDPAKMDPHNRQSADHSMAYIIATLLRKALESGTCGWSELMLLPKDYNHEALYHPLTRSLMSRVRFAHGGQRFDDLYPEGIPTQMEILSSGGDTYDSGLVMFPAGHCQNNRATRPVDVWTVLSDKWLRLGMLVCSDPEKLVDRYLHLPMMNDNQLSNIDDVPLLVPRVGSCLT